MADARPVQPVLTPNCPNCGALVTGQYCANCGQRLMERKLSLRRILMDVLEDQFSLNSALPRTLRGLFFKPGFLTNEYLALKIARYIPPFRLYLISSLLFFLTASFASSRSTMQLDPEELASVDSIMAAERAAAALRGDTLRSTRWGVHLDLAGSGKRWVDNVVVNLGNERLNRLVRARLESLAHLPPDQGFKTLMREFLQQAPKAVFLLLPLYALLFKLFYIGSKRYYVEHFIFALHVHAFTFLMFFLMIVSSALPVVTGLLLLWLVLYMYIAMKRVYKQGWFLTLVKWGVIGFTYLIVLVCGMVLAFVAAVLSV